MRYVYDKKANKMVPLIEGTPLAGGPYIQGDLPAYASPLGTGMIEGRTARREDMARGGSREVDPSERPEGAGIVKSKAQAAAERAQLDARRGFEMPERVRRELLRK